MTQARIKPKPPTASGFTISLCSQLYSDRIAGRPIEPLVVVGILRVVGDHRDTTSDGESSFIKVEFDHLEVLNEAAGDDVDRVRAMIDESRGRRGTPDQPSLFPDSGDRDELLRAIQLHCDDAGLDLDVEWVREYGDEYVAAPNKASVFQLRAFAYKVGATATSPVADDEPGMDGEPPVEDVALPAFIEPEPVSS